MANLVPAGASRPKPLFPSFFLGGFECSSPLNFDRRRVDELVLTGHDSQVRDDYRLLNRAGIFAARDGVRWNLVDDNGRLDFASAIPFLEAAEETGLAVIWDLFHYGYPEDLDPLHEPFVERFALYCEAFARLLVHRDSGRRSRRGSGFRFYTPINEISFFAWAGAEVGMFAPFYINRAPELKRRLCEAAIAGINAIRAVDPLARFVNCDPIVHVVAPRDMPWLADEAAYFNERYVCEAWDMLAGRTAPELGGSLNHLDIVGVNYYGVNQWEHQRPGSVLNPDDPRRERFSSLLKSVHRRYGRPVLVAETASIDEDRPNWLAQIARECEEAMAEGVELQGICIYPIVGMADWHSGGIRRMGLWDSAGENGRLRVPHAPTMAVLRELQRRLDPGRDKVSARRRPRPTPARV